MQAEDFEREFVRKVYDEISEHFSSTRYKRWPVVDEFLKAIPATSVGVDLGCGNGKNLTFSASNGSLFMVAYDACEGLLNFCRNKGFDSILGTVLKVPFADASFDFALSIAVLHHLRTPERRSAAIYEMLRVMRPGGRALAFVWSFEDNSSVRRHKLTQLETEQDVLVPWQVKGNGIAATHERYYHLFRKGELDALILEAGGAIECTGFDQDNWYVVFTKR